MAAEINSMTFVAASRAPTALAPASLASIGADDLSRAKARGVSDSRVTELAQVLRWMQEVFGLERYRQIPGTEFW